MTKSRMLAIAGAVGAMSLLVAQVAPPPTPPDYSEDNGEAWEIVPGAVAMSGVTAADGPGGAVEPAWIRGDMYLYNKHTGKAYVYLFDCMDSGTGCFAGVPVLEAGDSRLAMTPRPQAGSTSRRSR